MDGNRKLFLGKFPREMREEDVREMFGKYTQIERIDVKNGFCFVVCATDEDAKKIFEISQTTPFMFGDKKINIEMSIQNNGTKECYICHEQGHIARNCPMKRDSYRQGGYRSRRVNSRSRSRSYSRRRSDRSRSRSRSNSRRNHSSRRNRRDDYPRRNRRDDYSRSDSRSTSRRRSRSDSRRRSRNRSISRKDSRSRSRSDSRRRSRRDNYPRNSPRNENNNKSPRN